MTNGLRICLWFDTQAEEAARFYTSVFKESRMGGVTRFTEVGREQHGHGDPWQISETRCLHPNLR